MKIAPPTIPEIENIIATVQKGRDTWHGDEGYARFLDIELHALHLLLMITRIAEEETTIAESKKGGVDAA